MLEVRVEEEVEANSSAVWGLMREFGGIKRWSPEIASCEVEGDGVGAVRTIGLQGITIKERLEHFDDAARTFRYSIIAGPLPLKNYLSTVQVSDAGATRSRITWSSTFEAAGLSDDQAKQLVEMIYRNGIAGVRKALR